MTESATASTAAESTATTSSRLPKLGEIPGFVEYMGKGWDVPDRTPPVVRGAAAAAAAHRARLSAALPGKTIVVAAGQAPVRANDTNYDFRPDSGFAWLTGCTTVEDAVVVVSGDPGSGGDAVLYVPMPAYPGEAGFFTDAMHGELWVGAAPGLAEWSSALDIEVRPLSAFEEDFSRLAEPLIAGAVAAAGPLAGRTPDAELGRVLAELRMFKDDWEIAQLRDAVNHTVDGFAAVAREFGAAVERGGERWLQGTFDRHARTVGNGTGYASIVGSGKHAPTLHWVRCDGPLLPDELVLLDMGVEVNSLYTADVTRTFPASGTFSPAQRQVHDLVEASHRAGLAAVGPGRPFTDFHHACMEVLARGLDGWGLLPVSVDEALSPAGQHHRRYIVCGVGHHLGLDVHDCSKASPDAYHGATMAPGMVLTVEPGLYFHAHDLTVPPELRGIGVRIEDDLLVTPSGAEVLSDALPLSTAGLEAWLRSR